MKLSKSKLALAKVINENGGWHGSDVWLFSTQSGDGVLKFWASKPKALKGCVCTEWSGGCRLNFALSRVIKNWHQCVLSREEYYHAYPKADADGWIDHNGKSNPVGEMDVVDVLFGNGRTSMSMCAGKWNWGWAGKSSASGFLIEKYRLHKPDVKPEFCESVTRSIPGSESIDELCAKVTEENKHQHVDANPTIEQLAQDYRNKLDFAKRKQDEADKANMESDAALSQLEDAIAAIGFVITPLAATVKEPELVAAVKVGDQVECVESNINRDKYNGMVGRLHFIDESDTSAPYLVDFGGKAEIWCHEVKFIRRP